MIIGMPKACKLNTTLYHLLLQLETSAALREAVLAVEVVCQIRDSVPEDVERTRGCLALVQPENMKSSSVAYTRKVLRVWRKG